MKRIAAVAVLMACSNDKRLVELEKKVDKLSENTNADYYKLQDQVMELGSSVKEQMPPRWWCIDSSAGSGAGACWRTQQGCMSLIETVNKKFASASKQGCVQRRIAYCDRDNPQGACVGAISVCQSIGKRKGDNLLGEQDARCIGVE